jgi:LysR family transcriptional regulator for metE and metH
MEPLPKQLIRCTYLNRIKLQYQKLEGQIATPICQKDGRNLRLTAAGERIQTLANRVLPQF